MEFKQNVSLKPFNTFGIDITSRYFAEVNVEDDYQKLRSSPLLKENRLLIIGEGSNILFSSDFDGLVVKINTKGIEILAEDADEVTIKVQAGENWKDFVKFCISKKYAGIENLSMIPGNVGGSPVQNIGAYGAEVKDVIQEVETLEIESGRKVIFSNAECKFGYRNSIFKNELKNKFIITSVTFKLSKKACFSVSYGSIAKELRAMCLRKVTLESVGEAVCNLRTQKLPDPKDLGNGGSFFKNPIVSSEKYGKLKSLFPNIIAYEVPGIGYKLAAGWMIEQCQWKGKRLGNVGVYDKQALIIVNYGEAKGTEVLEFAEKIRESVQQKFDIKLDFEINVI
jgi:UDP-N-acetylmuramate dehydrogenase